MKVSLSDYYEWLTNPGSNRAKVDQELMLLVKQCLNEGRSNYGSRSIKARMKEVGNNISRRRIIRLIREANLTCKIKSKRLLLILGMISLLLLIYWIGTLL